MNTVKILNKTTIAMFVLGVISGSVFAGAAESPMKTVEITGHDLEMQKKAKGETQFVIIKGKGISVGVKSGDKAESPKIKADSPIELSQEKKEEIQKAIKVLKKNKKNKKDKGIRVEGSKEAELLPKAEKKPKKIIKEIARDSSPKSVWEKV